MFKIPGKIPIYIYPFFWVVAFLIGWLNTANIPATIIWAAVILVSILVHEFGHALTALAFGQKVRIELIGFGGVTHRKGGSRLQLWQEFIIVFNGPLAGFCLAGIAWWLNNVLLAAHSLSFLTYALQVAFLVNFYWTILNLLPVQPLDGGKLLSIILESIFGLKGTKIALFFSIFLASVLVVISFIMRYYLMGAFFMLFAFDSYKAWKESLSITEEDNDAVLQNLMKDAESTLRNGNDEQALEIFQKVRKISKKGVIYQAATENAAQLLANKDDFKTAYEMIISLGSKVSPDGLNLLHQLAYHLKKWEDAASIGNNVYKTHPNYQTAFINAATNAALGMVKPAIGWLECAIHDGLPNPYQVLAGKDFDGIRNDPVFRIFLENIR